MALHEHKRATDVRNLVQDRNLEVTDLLYLPVASSFEDLTIGDGDPEKAGAIAAYLEGGKYHLATYNGDGTWTKVGGSSTPTVQDVHPGSPTYTLVWTPELKAKHGPIPKEPTVLVKAGSDPPDVWSVLRSTVKYTLDGNSELVSMVITISNLQAKIIIQ